MAKLIAITTIGQEYMYSRSSAHLAPARSADFICSVLNKCNYKLKDGEAWHVYDVGTFDIDSSGASYQRFKIRNNHIFDSTY